MTSAYLEKPLRTIAEAQKDIENNRVFGNVGGERTVVSGRTSPQSVEIKEKNQLNKNPIRKTTLTA